MASFHETMSKNDFVVCGYLGSCKMIFFCRDDGGGGGGLVLMLVLFGGRVFADGVICVVDSVIDEF